MTVTVRHRRPSVALVYDLRDEYLALGYSDEETAEFDSPATIDALEASIRAASCDVVRVGRGQALAARLAAGTSFDLVFSIAEGLKGRSREAQVAALCELFDQPYVFSDPLTMAASLDKAWAKRIVRDAGVPTASFAVAETSLDEVKSWRAFPAFVKPLAEGTGKGCERASMVNDAAGLKAAVDSILIRFRQPALVEAFLPGREFTVGIVGNGADARVLGVCEIVMNTAAEQGVYSFANKELSEELVTYTRVDDYPARRSADLALKCYRALQCRDAARIDFRCDESGDPVFLEANPLAGLHPTHSDLPILAAQNGIGHERLISMILDAAFARYGLSRHDEERALEIA